MKKSKKLWLSMALGVLLMATVVGIAVATPNARAEAQRQWRVIAVPTQACIPRDDDTDYYHVGAAVRCNEPRCAFVCPVTFPAAGEQAAGSVTVKRVTMYAWDNITTQSAKVYLFKEFPRYKNNREMAGAETSDSANDPQTVMDTSISYNPLLRTQGAYIWLIVDNDIKVFGFEIHYTW